MTQWIQLGQDVMREARRARGLSYESTSRLLHISSKTYERWEKRGAVPRHEVESVANVLGLEIEVPDRVSAGRERASDLDEVRADLAAVQASVDGLELLIRERLGIPPDAEASARPGERPQVRVARSRSRGSGRR